MATSNRRSFLRTAGLGAAGAALASPAAAQPAGANERFVVGVIGPGGMGMNHVRTLLPRKDVQIAWVCDADRSRLDAAAQAVQKATGRGPQTTQDMRRVLDDRAVDAVFIATPDHWHGPAAILACIAGKHVYVEKPCSHNIREGRLMIEAARRHRRVMQVGTQTRSSAHAVEAMRLLRDGAIGEVLTVRVWNSQLRRNIGRQQPTKPPANLDYDVWVGPAPLVPYQANRLHGVWRWWYHFGCGDMGNDGVHDIDLGCWGLGVTTHPTRVAALGGKYFFDDDQQFPDTQTVLFEYDGQGKTGRKKQLIFEQRIWSPYTEQGHENGNAFFGTQGMLVLGKGSGWTLYGPRNKEIKRMRGSPNLPAHHTNFFECIRSGNRPNADIEINHLATTLCHLGNIATRVGRTLRFDPRTERFVSDKDANALVSREYRAGHWAVPQGV
ncbi:MAG: Gfo/Idh/MocA family oxidoreductase [Gemmataceae bacterium]|nr:Gfo/Idh/MocA family oxidoreductase [Gemmataceae bacterium]